MIGTYYYQYEFLKLTTSFKEMITDDTLESSITIIKTVILDWDYAT